MKKFIKASNSSRYRTYWADVRMKVAIKTNSTDTSDISDEIYDAVADGLADSAIADYEWIDVSDVSLDHNSL